MSKRYVLVDILRVFDGYVEIDEVKSSTSDDDENSDDIKDTI